MLDKDPHSLTTILSVEVFGQKDATVVAVDLDHSALMAQHVFEQVESFRFHFLLRLLRSSLQSENIGRTTSGESLRPSSVPSNAEKCFSMLPKSLAASVIAFLNYSVLPMIQSSFV